MSFVDGGLYGRSFETPVGTIGPRIELRDFAVYPRGSVRLTVPPSELLGWARLARSELADAGFEELRVTGTRLTGAGPGRKLDLTIRLRREEP